MAEFDLSEIQGLVKQNRIIPFIGAGISLEAEFSNGTYPPSDIQLLEKLFNKAIQNGADFEECDFLKLYEFDRSELTNSIKKFWGDELGFQIRMLLNYSTVKPSQHQRILGLLRFKILLTTNYDTIIEDTVYPRPEKIILYNQVSINHVLKEIDTTQSKRPVLIKLNGCQSQPESIALGSGIEYYRKYWSETFEKLMGWERQVSLLFMGYSLNDNDFIQFLLDLKSRYLQKEFRHFCIVTYKEYRLLSNEKFIKDLNIQLIYFKIPENDSYSASSGYNGLWQILSQLRIENELDLSHNKQTGVFFNKDERAKYLDYQEIIEKEATCLRYLTPSPTNAISPTDYIKTHCKKGLVDLYNSPNFQALGVSVNEKIWVSEVVDIMLNRLITVNERMKSGAELRVLCFKKHIDEDFKSNMQIIRDKYQYILKIIDDDDYDLEVRMIPDDKIKEGQASFALISSPNNTSTDVALAYAAQANKNDFILHVIERNTNFVKSNLIEFESYWARAVDENKTREYIRELIEQYCE